MNDILSCLLNSDEPSIRYKTMTDILAKSDDTPEVRKARAAIKKSFRTAALLSRRDRDGRIRRHPYAKWIGAHWILVALADLGYPPGDKKLIPLREQVYGWLLSDEHARHIQVINHLTRRCASQEGNALYATLYLGMADDRADGLAARLCRWQWPDGGWNCDKDKSAHISSFRETIVPLRALSLHARLTGNRESKAAAAKAAELLLGRMLFRRRSDGTVMRESFIRLHYPRYFEYDILFALAVMAEAGFIKDKRCCAALDLLESKRLPGGGFPCEEKYYRTTSPEKGSRFSPIDWGGSSGIKMNEFVTVDALSVLRKAGRN